MTGAMTRRWLAAAMIAVLALLSGSPAIAEPVKVRAATHDGYGRIVFNWPTPVVFNAAKKGDRLTVRFGRPIEASYAAVVRALRTYIRNATPGADGRSVTFTLRGQYAISSFNMGATVVVDIVKKPATAGPKPIAKTDRQQLVRVRTGQHQGYTRVVFDWPKRVGYGIDRQDGKAVLSFDRRARIDLKPLQGRPPKYIGGATLKDTTNGVAVVLRIAKNSRLRDFRSGPKVVIDIMAPSQQGPVGKAAVKKIPIPATAKTIQKKEPAPVKTAKPTPLTPGQPRPLTPPGLTNGSPTGGGSSGLLSKKDKAALKLLAGVEIINPKAAPVGPGTAKPNGGDAVTIRINWKEPVAAAVFRRAGYLWVVFDKPAKIDLAALRAAAGNIIRDLKQLPNERATLLRMTTLSGVNPSLKRDGLAWILVFRQQPLQPVSNIEITPQPRSPIGARLFMSVTEPGEGIVLNDPATGDNLIIVPVIPLGYGIAVGRDYPQVKILPSSQGIVIKPKIDDLRVRSLRQGVELTSGTGLLLSDIPAELAAESKINGGASLRKFSRLFNLDKWRQTRPDTFTAERQRLQLAAATAPLAKRDQARMDLARFFFANGYGAEALGVLQDVAKDNPKVAKTTEYRGISGAIDTLMRRFKKAHAELDNSAIGSNDEGVFWRAVLRAYEGDLAGAAPNIRRMEGVIRRYPKALKIPLSMLIAKAAIKLGDAKLSGRYIEALRAMGLNSAQKSELDYIEGKRLELTGNVEGAIGKWEKVQQGTDRLFRAKAAMARTKLLMKLGQINDSQAIKNMEKLRYAWRGDAFEFNLLRRLGELYLKTGDYRNGLRTLRQAVTRFRDYKKAPEVTKEMTDAFARLYLGNAADSLQPITAIALYDEFKELTPPGKPGDEMIRKLADRLVNVDLLDRAASLLKAQVDFRLQGVEKARVGARLALIQILALEYDKAIESLKKSETKGLPDGLTQQRRHLKARALMGLQRTDEALALLKDDKSAAAEQLRMEIFWNNRDWKQAAGSLQRLVNLSGAKPKKPVTKKQGEYLLNLAVAMTLSGDNLGIARIKADYGAAMESTTYRDAFRLIASSDKKGLINYSSISGKIADAENFQSFMAAYQERLKESKLSAIN